MIAHPIFGVILPQIRDIFSLLCGCKYRMNLKDFPMMSLFVDSLFGGPNCSESEFALYHSLTAPQTGHTPLRRISAPQRPQI